MAHKVVHFEINARDGKRAQQFYGEMFKWNMNANNPMNYALVDTGDKKGVQGGIGQVDAGKTPYVTFYIAVDNPQAYLDRALSLGGAVVMPVTVIPNMVTFAQFADPEGNVIGLVLDQMPPKRKAAKKKPAKKKTKSRKKSRR